MRYLGVDLGGRRIGLALSDASGVLASPWRVVAAGADPGGSATVLAEVIRGLTVDADYDGELAAVVVGLPRRLDGSDNDQTAPARVFAAKLAELTSLPVHLQDERLTSHEAESLLSIRERDWRKRKEKLDAAAAAVILQEFLDSRPDISERRV